MKQIMCALIRQGVDRLDKIRGLSCMVITSLLHRLELVLNTDIRIQI